jgi:bifunctional DNA-binding transcriptional regulator/antitoxin component of YhaV-PrlF toxin-antitoxin module
MTTTLSPKFQIVIPREVRGFLKLKPGIKYTVMPELNGVIKLYPIKTKTMKDLFGIAKGINTDIEREPDREL